MQTQLHYGKIVKVNLKRGIMKKTNLTKLNGYVIVQKLI